MPYRSRLLMWIFVLVLASSGRLESTAFVPPKPFSTSSSWKHSTRSIEEHSTSLPAAGTIHRSALKRLPLSTRLALSTTPQNENGDNFNYNENDEEDTENASSPGRLKRKRDRIKQWMSSSSSSSSSSKSPMVRPIRKDGSVEEEEPPRPRTGSRLKANFDDLFAGMPSMQDILADGKEEDDDDDLARPNKKRKLQDDSWFDEEKKEIEANYQEIFQEMVAQLQEQRRQEPDSVPSNAEAMMQDVLRQEMKTEIKATREMRATEDLAKYSDQQKEAVEAQDMEGVTNEVVDNLLKEDQVAQERADAAQARVDEYRRYELESFLKSQTGSGSSGTTGVQAPAVNADLDQWALERLQDMVDTRQDGSDEDFIVTDIVEDSLEDLKERIEREAGRSSRIQPETLKEWQMYRAISSRLGMQDAAKDLSEDATEEQIANQLQSWKDYIAKEIVIREKSGLSRGPKLPFEWQESSRDKEIEDAQIQAALEKQGYRTKVEIRKEVNRKSIEALESLLVTSDPIRGARLKTDIAALKQELEANDYLDIDESALQEEPEDVGPVDISDVFSSSNKAPTVAPMPSWNEYAEPPPPNSSGFEDTNTGSVESTGAGTPPPNTAFFSDEDDVNSPLSPPPGTPFFAQGNDETAATTGGPPDSPFFSSSESDSDGADDAGGSKYRLGTVDEQKLRAMYQRAGARTDEEKAVIRTQWEEFQKFEKSRRDESGLTDGDDSGMMDRADINYDIAEVTKADGDFDAEKILASIGPRPTRKRKAESISQPPSSDMADEPVSSSSDLDTAEVTDSLYRAVSAVGGGRTKDDPEAKAQEKAAFSEFMEKENEMRQSLDDLDDTIASELSGVEGEFDDSSYAEDALSSLGPRPKPKRRKLSETEYSDRSIALSDDDDDNDDDDEEDQTTGYTNQVTPESNNPDDSVASEDDFVPGWLRKERESVRSQGASSGGRGSFLGSDIDEVFDDDTYEHNQRQLAEYERRRAGGRKQMGIDIAAVLGKSSDDYADYTFDDNYIRAKKSGWGTSGFESRKANLLEYTELNVIELNALMDFKDSVHSTGMSQYLPRINKPFKEFGAVFRLEGVLIDTTGMQYEAWTRVAKEKGFKIPSVEEVRRASVLRSDVAVREAFFWTDDVIMCRETAAAHQRALDDVFSEWMKESSISPPTTQPEAESTRGSLAMGEEEAPTMQPAPVPKLDVDEGKQIKLLADAWSRTAITHRLVTPSREQLEMACVVTPDIAVRNAFQWSVDQSEIDVYVATFRSIMEDLLGNPSGQSQTPKPVETRRELEQPKRVLDQNAMMEIQFKAWSKLAEENAFEMPLPEEVMAAVTINDPEIAIRDGFDWTDDMSRLPALIASYRDSVAELVNEFNGEISSPSVSTPTPETAAVEQPTSSKDSIGPTEEERLEMQLHAWKSAALNHGFQAPPVDQLQVAMRMTPSESVTRLFGWTSDEAVVEAVCATFDSALSDISQKYIRKYSLPPGAALFPGQRKAEAAPQRAIPDTDDVTQVIWEAWNTVAKKNGLPMPDEEQVLFAMSVGPEDAVISGFEWAMEPAEVSKLVDGYNAELKQWRSRHGNSSPKAQQKEPTPEALPLISVVPGAEKWLRSLLEVEIQCSVVSHMSRQQLDVLLEVSGLSHLFSPDKRVAASNNYGREMDQLLGAALRVERRPDHCVVFDTSPNAAVATHDVEMRSVAVIGPFPRYELLVADSTASSFDELTAMNIRRLFGERVYDQPMVDMQQADPERITRQETKTKLFYDD